MSDFNLKTITAPSLTSVNFGQNIQEQFQNIQNNFEILSNHDFVKGSPGKSITIVKVPMSSKTADADKYKGYSGEMLCNLIRSTVNERYKNAPSKLNPIQLGEEFIPLNWDDNIAMGDAYLIFKEEELVSSFAYILLDNRYNNIMHTSDKTYLYAGTVDVSAGFYFTTVNGQAQAQMISNWPTLYYDNDLNDFCWLYQGRETKLPARGPKGESFTVTQNIFTVKVDTSNISANKICRIVQLIDNRPGSINEGEWIDIDTYLDGGKNVIPVGSMAITFGLDEKTHSSRYWISTIGNTPSATGTPVYNVICNENQDITTTFNQDAFKNMMACVHITSKISKSLFVPFVGTAGYDDKLKIHAVFALPGIKGRDSETLNIAPIVSEADIPDTQEKFDKLAGDKYNSVVISSSVCNIWHNELNARHNLNVTGKTICHDVDVLGKLVSSDTANFSEVTVSDASNLNNIQSNSATISDLLTDNIEVSDYVDTNRIKPGSNSVFIEANIPVGHTGHTTSQHVVFDLARLITLLSTMDAKKSEAVFGTGVEGGLTRGKTAFEFCTNQ